MSCSFFFFFNDTATTEIYTLSLHDALPILHAEQAETQALHAIGAAVVVDDRKPRLPIAVFRGVGFGPDCFNRLGDPVRVDRKSTRLNSSHSQISYAVFCLKKKKTTQTLDIS